MRRIVWVVIILASGCAVGTPTPAPSTTASPLPGPSPVPSPMASVSAANVSGAWVFGSMNEPGAGPVVVTCLGYTSTTLNLSQSGTSLTGNVAECSGACRLSETLTGQDESGHVILSGTASGAASPAPVVYDLRFDAATQHLTGTRDGRPFWAAPAVPASPKSGGCPL